MADDFYLDDDDELRKMRERFQMERPQQSDYGAAVGGAGQYGAPSADLDPGMLQSFLQQRPADVRQQAYPIPQRESPSFLEDNAFPIAAGIGDLIVNHGRNLGQITQGVIAGKNARLNRESQQFEADRGAYMKQQDAEAEQQARTQNYGIQSGNLELRQKEAALAEARERGLMERFTRGLPDPELTKREKEAEIRLRESQANENDATANEKWTGADKAITPFQQATLDATKEERHQRDLDRDADRDYRKTTHADAAAATAAQKAETNRRLQETADTTATNAFLGKTKDERSQAALLQGVQPIVDDPKYKKDLPGVGSVDSWAPSWLMHPVDSQARNDADRMKQMAGEAQTYFRHQITGASASPRELAALEALKGLNGTEAQFKTALKTWQDMLQGDIRAAASASPDNARNALDAQGLGGMLPPRAAPPPVAPQPEEVPFNPNVAPMPDDRTTPGPDVVPPAQRLGPTGPKVRGTPGFAGSGPSSNIYQGPTNPQDSPAITDWLQKLQQTTRTPGVRYRP